MIRVDVPVGTQLFYDDAADFVNVIKGFPETGQGARNFTGQKFSECLPVRLNGVVESLASYVGQ